MACLSHEPWPAAEPVRPLSGPCALGSFGGSFLAPFCPSLFGDSCSRGPSCSWCTKETYLTPAPGLQDSLPSVPVERLGEGAVDPAGFCLLDLAQGGMGTGYWSSALWDGLVHFSHTSPFALPGWPQPSLGVVWPCLCRSYLPGLLESVASAWERRNLLKCNVCG